MIIVEVLTASLNGPEVTFLLSPNGEAVINQIPGAPRLGFFPDVIIQRPHLHQHQRNACKSSASSDGSPTVHQPYLCRQGVTREEW